MLNPYYTSPEGDIVIFNADCLDVLPQIPDKDDWWNNRIKIIEKLNRLGELLTEHYQSFYLKKSKATIRRNTRRIGHAVRHLAHFLMLQDPAHFSNIKRTDEHVRTAVIEYYLALSIFSKSRERNKEQKLINEIIIKGGK